MTKHLEQFDNINMNLHLLKEECLEVAMCCSKAMRFGIADIDPDNPLAEEKYKLLEQEIGDIMALIDILKFNKVGLTDEGIEAAKQRKFKKLAGYYGDFVVNKSLGF